MVSPGGNRERATPVPIPNTVVKPLIADGTAWVTVWESRTLPGFEIIYKLKRPW